MNPEDIRIFRKGKKLTQESLGELCGVSKAAVSRWEKGIDSPSGSAMKILQRLKSGETVVSELSDLEIKLLDQNVSIEKLKDREDYLTASLKHLLQFGEFLSIANSGNTIPMPQKKAHLMAAAGSPILAEGVHGR